MSVTGPPTCVRHTDAPAGTTAAAAFPEQPRTVVARLRAGTRPDDVSRRTWTRYFPAGGISAGTVPQGMSGTADSELFGDPSMTRLVDVMYTSALRSGS